MKLNSLLVSQKMNKKPSPPLTNNVAKHTAVQNADGTSSSSNGYINLRVISSDYSTEIQFRVKITTKLVRLKKVYSRQSGLIREEINFTFDGYRITDEDTPESLGMSNNDIIEVYQQRYGGGAN